MTIDCPESSARRLSGSGTSPTSLLARCGSRHGSFPIRLIVPRCVTQAVRKTSWEAEKSFQNTYTNVLIVVILNTNFVTAVTLVNDNLWRVCIVIMIMVI